jgi:hypothetical protein
MKQPRHDSAAITQQMFIIMYKTLECGMREWGTGEKEGQACVKILADVS